jgi:tol-pal system protein YbgF
MSRFDMFEKKYFIGLGLLATLSFSACANQGSGADSQLMKEVRDMRLQQAEQGSNIEELKNQVRELNGKLEEVQFAGARPTQPAGTGYNGNARMKEGAATVAAGVSPLLISQDEQAIARISGPAADLFRSGLNQVKVGGFSDSLRTFGKFVVENPGTAFTDNGMYWLGVSYDQLGQYDLAIEKYSMIYKDYPAEDRAPDALLNLGESFLKIGDKTAAIDSWNIIIDEYGNTEVAKRAKIRIQEEK